MTSAWHQIRTRGLPHCLFLLAVVAPTLLVPVTLWHGHHGASPASAADACRRACHAPPVGHAPIPDSNSGTTPEHANCAVCHAALSLVADLPLTPVVICLAGDGAAVAPPRDCPATRLALPIHSRGPPSPQLG